MELIIHKATSQHQRYFSKTVLEFGAAYVVSDANSVVGMFSFEFVDEQATMNFPFCINKKAIALALNTFLKDYPNIVQVKLLSRQNLEDLGFKNKIYTK